MRVFDQNAFKDLCEIKHFADAGSSLLKACFRSGFEMTVYILGGSSTVMTGGWADSFATQIVRRFPVRNLAMGGGNTQMALVRLMREAALQPGDTVVWATPIRDAMCLSGGAYADGALLRFSEELIWVCREAGAGVIPLLMDSRPRDLDLRQPAYKAALLELLDAYGLEGIDVTAEFQRETGLPRVPMQYFDATGHLIPGSDMSLFVADLVTDRLIKGAGVPAAAQVQHADPARRLVILDRFRPEEMSEKFENRLVSETVWQPGVDLPPDLRPAGDLEIEGLVLLADPEGGAIDLKTDHAHLSLSATCLVNYYRGPIFQTVYLPNILGGTVALPAGDTLRIGWARSGEGLLADQLFRPRTAPGPSRARISSVLCRPAGTPTD